MDDFFKTKSGFTIGLLAALFAIKPIVDASSSIGFELISVRVTVEHCYLFTISLLGLAVYFNSCQFLSTKHYRFLDVTSSIAYGAALFSPAAYALIWFFITFGKFVVSTFSLEEINNIVSIIAAFLGLIPSVLATFKSSRIINIKFEKLKADNESDENIVHLKRAKELLALDMYDMSIIETSKVVESSLKSLLLSLGIYVQNLPMLQLIRESRKHGLLTEEQVELLDELRKTRNQTVHALSDSSKEDAQKALRIASELFQKLSL
ncbi:hypothetical protein ACX13_12990 [Vibrio parahaemolyticus]|nr:HEPN domain-containing protein [Vibrio alginolyticus]KOF29188.1 hypothetical protein ACX13_12990 [Vibrio parahaemolyticus]